LWVSKRITLLKLRVWKLLLLERGLLGDLMLLKLGLLKLRLLKLGLLGEARPRHGGRTKRLNYVKGQFVILVHYRINVFEDMFELPALRLPLAPRESTRLALSTKSSAFAFRTTLAQTSHKKTWSVI
jgi:hypothetical protein